LSPGSICEIPGGHGNELKRSRCGGIFLWGDATKTQRAQRREKIRVFSAFMAKNAMKKIASSYPKRDFG